MWQFVFIPILFLAVPSNALSSCKTVNASSTVVQGEKCLAKDPTPGPFDSAVFTLVDETLRNILKTGYPEKLPVLDPLVITDLNLTLGDENGDYEPLRLHLESGTLQDLATYVVNTATYALVGSAIVVAIDIPDIKLTAKYDMDGWLGGGLLYLYGDGNIELSLETISLYVELDVGSDMATSIALLECIALDYDVGGVQVNVTGLLGGGELGDIFNLVLQDAIPTLIDIAEDTLLGKVSCLLKDKVNTLFKEKGITLQALLCAAGIGFGCK